MSGWTKLHSSMITSTIWRESKNTRLLWVTMLMLSDKDGFVVGSVPGLAHMANLTIEETEESLSELMSPDKYSKSKDNEGRRIEETDDGWFIINYQKYRAPTSTERVRKHREQKKQNETLHCVSNRSSGSKEFPSGSGSASVNTSLEESSSSEEVTSQVNVDTLLPLSPTDTLLLETIKTKTKTKKKEDITAETSVKYLKVFNASFEKSITKARPLNGKVNAAMKEGYTSDEICCIPIIQAGIDNGAISKLDQFSPDILLRDGKHARTSKNGATYGATDWIGKTFLKASESKIDYRLKGIAEHFGLLETLKKLGCKIAKNENDER